MPAEGSQDESHGDAARHGLNGTMSVRWTAGGALRFNQNFRSMASGKCYGSSPGGEVVEAVIVGAEKQDRVREADPAARLEKLLAEQGATVEFDRVAHPSRLGQPARWWSRTRGGRGCSPRS